jgi:hypothetical protein
MIKHTVVYTFKSSATEQQKTALMAELDDFPKLFPAMRNWTSGVNISSRDRTFTHAFNVEFQSENELQDYLLSAGHERFVREKFFPIVERRAVISYEV